VPYVIYVSGLIPSSVCYIFVSGSILIPSCNCWKGPCSLYFTVTTFTSSLTTVRRCYLNPFISRQICEVTFLPVVLFFLYLFYSYIMHIPHTNSLSCLENCCDLSICTYWYRKLTQVAIDGFISQTYLNL
jgi:hypothetical protein